MVIPPNTVSNPAFSAGMEGEVHSRADELKGVYISANLPIKISFPIEGNTNGKRWIAHMKEDELEIL
jgi:hypothetical protein